MNTVTYLCLPVVIVGGFAAADLLWVAALGCWKLRNNDDTRQIILGVFLIGESAVHFMYRRPLPAIFHLCAGSVYLGMVIHQKFKP